jgi:hypothetical protein
MHDGGHAVERRGQRLRLGQVAAHDLGAALAKRLSLLGVAREDANAVHLRQQPRHEAGADSACGSGDEGGHASAPNPSGSLFVSRLPLAG